MDVEKDGGEAYRVTGRAHDAAGGRVRPLPRAVRDAGRRRFELRYVPQAENRADEAEREVAEDDLTTAFYREGAIDLIELMHEQFVLALPMKPLCAQACKGLCGMRDEPEQDRLRLRADGTIHDWPRSRGC